jgi:hypothetical protein
MRPPGNDGHQDRIALSPQGRPSHMDRSKIESRGGTTSR